MNKVGWYATGQEIVAGETIKVCATSIDASQVTIEQALHLQKLTSTSKFVNDEVEILYRDGIVTFVGTLNATRHTHNWCKKWIGDIRNAFYKAGIITRNALKADVRSGILTL